MIINPKKILEKSKKEDIALGAFNVGAFEIVKAIFEASNKTGKDVIIETSESEAGYFSPAVIAGIVEQLSNQYGIDVALHCDHGKSLNFIKECIAVGYSSVHMDASDKGFTENASLTKEAVDLAHREDVWVEGEIGLLAGESTPHEGDVPSAVTEDGFTDPGEAKKFTEVTGIDQLAITIGNVHGTYETAPVLDFDRLKLIRETVSVPLVLHGGSGIKDEDIRKCIELGINIVHVNTELRVAFKKALAEASNSDEVFKPYDMLNKVIEEVARVVEEKLKLFSK